MDRQSILQLENFYSKCIFILNDILEVKNHLSFEDIFAENFSQGIKKKQDPYDDLITELIDKNFDIYSDYETRSEINKAKNKAYFIYTHSLFERYKVHLRIDANNFSRKAEKLFYKELMKYASKRKEEKKDNSLFDALVDLDESKSEVPKHLYKLDNILRIERLAYGFLPPDSKIYEETSQLFDLFVISREVRNLITHRDDVVDDQLISQIKQAITKKYRDNNDYLTDLCIENDFSFLNNKFPTEEFNKEYKKIAKRFEVYNFPVRVTTRGNLALIENTILIAFLSEFLVFKDQGEEAMETTLGCLGDCINSLLILYSKFKDVQILRFCYRLVTRIEENIPEIKENKSDVFRVNKILVFNEELSRLKTFEFFKEKHNKKFITNIKTKSSELKKIIELEKSQIDDKKIKNIIDKFLILEMDEFIKAINLFLKSQEKPNYNDLKNWFMIASLSGFPIIDDFIRKMTDSEKELEKQKKSVQQEESEHQEESKK
jgi:hypothetical protein